MYDGVVLTHARYFTGPSSVTMCDCVPHTLRHPPGPGCPLNALSPPVCAPHHSGTPRAQAAAADAIGHMCLPATLMLSTNGKDGKPQKVNPKLLVRGGGEGRLRGAGNWGEAGRMKKRQMPGRAGAAGGPSSIYSQWIVLPLHPAPFPPSPCQCVNKGAVEPLVKLLASSDEACICESADTLEILAGCDEGVT